MKLLVNTCCQITDQALNKRFTTKEILPCMVINTNFGEMRCSPPPRRRLTGMWIAPEYIDTHDDRFSQTGQGVVIWADLFSVTSEVEFPDNTYNFLSQMLHNPLLTLLFVRLFPTSCFDKDFTIESFPRLFFYFRSALLRCLSRRAEERSNVLLKNMLL